MTLEGHVENGAIVCDNHNPLPEGAKVRVEVVAKANGSEPDNDLVSAIDRVKLAVQQAKGKSPAPDAKTLAERYAAALGAAADLPADMAERHDRYIHRSEP